MKKIYLLFAALAALIAGCRTPEYYQDIAVQKARAYLLKNSPQLTFEESSYIRFNKPSIVHSNIIGSTGSLDSSRITSDINQIQIVWNIPGNENFYAVWGVCSSTMRDFSPERIFVRKFHPQDTHRINAVKKAKTYIIGNLFSMLSVEDYNELRFREPEIYYSKFELEKDLMPNNGNVQIAMVWNLKTKPGTQLVVIGNGRKNLSSFKPVSGSELSDSEVKANLLEPYKRLTKEELRKEKAAQKPAPSPEKQNTAKEVKTPQAPVEVKTSPDTAKNQVPSSDDKTAVLSPDEARIRDIENSLKKDAENTPVQQAVRDEKIIDELPEAPELDTENDLKEPEK